MAGLNCTFMELKSENSATNAWNLNGLNCTFMELKLYYNYTRIYNRLLLNIL